MSESSTQTTFTPPRCRICGEPLSERELSLNRPWHVECQICHFCKEPLPNDEQTNRCLDSGRRVSHDLCHQRAMRADFKNKIVPLTREHVEHLNGEILNFYPAVDANSTDVSALYDLLLALQTCAANVSYALGMTKEQLLVRETRAFDFELGEKRKAERARKVEDEKEKLDRQARSEVLAAEREDPRLRARRKAVDGLVASGLRREDAESMLPPVSDLPTGNPNGGTTK